MYNLGNKMQFLYNIICLAERNNLYIVFMQDDIEVRDEKGNIIYEINKLHLSRHNNWLYKLYGFLQGYLK